MRMKSSFRGQGVKIINKKRLERIVSIISACLVILNCISPVNAKVFEIQNAAPTASVSADVLHQKKLDIVIITDYIGADITTINNKLNRFKSDREDNGVDVKFDVIDGSKYTQVGTYSSKPIYAIDVQQVKNSLLRDEAEHCIIALSDGIGNNNTSAYGKYYSFGSLNLQIANYIANKNFSIYVSTPLANLNYKMPNTSQEVTINQLINCSPIGSKHYDSAGTKSLNKLDDLLGDLSIKYNNTVEELFPSEDKQAKNVDIQVLTDYQNGTVAYNDLTNKVGNIAPTLYPYGVNFNFKASRDITNELLNRFKVKKIMYYSSTSTKIVLIDQYGDLYIDVNGFMQRFSQFKNVKDVFIYSEGLLVLCEDGNLYYFYGLDNVNGRPRSLYTEDAWIFTRLIFTNVDQVTEQERLMLLKKDGTLYQITNTDFVNIAQDSHLYKVTIPTTSKIVKISGSLALTADRKVYSAGYRFSQSTASYYSPYGQKSYYTRGSDIIDNSLIYKSVPEISNATYIESDRTRNIAVDSSYNVYAQGDNNDGKMGLPNRTVYESFAKVGTLSNSVKDIDINYQILYQLVDNKIYASSKSTTGIKYINNSNNSYVLNHGQGEQLSYASSYIDKYGIGYNVDAALGTATINTSDSGLISKGLPKITKMQPYRENWLLATKNKFVNFNNHGKPAVINTGEGKSVINVFSDDGVLLSDGTYHSGMTDEQYEPSVYDKVHINQFTSDYYEGTVSGISECAVIQGGTLYYGSAEYKRSLRNLESTSIPGIAYSFIGNDGGLWIHTSDGVFIQSLRIGDGTNFSNNNIDDYLEEYRGYGYHYYKLAYYKDGTSKKELPRIKSAFGNHEEENHNKGEKSAYYFVDYSNNIYRAYPKSRSDIPTKVSSAKYDVKFIDSAFEDNYSILLTNSGELYEGTTVSDNMTLVTGLPSKVKKANIVEGKILSILCEDGTAWIKGVPYYEGYGYTTTYGKLLSSTLERISNPSQDYFIDMDNSGAHLLTDDGLIYTVNGGGIDYFAEGSFATYRADNVISNNRKFFDQYDTYTGYMQTDLVLKWFSGEPNLYINPNLFRSFNDDGKEHIVLYVGDGTTLQKLRKNYRQQLIDKNVKFIAVAPDSSSFSNFIGSDTYQGLADVTGGKTFTNVDDAVRFIINQYLNLHDTPKGGYIVAKEDALLYKKIYDDYEKDSKYAERWKYNQDPTIFENNQGYIESNNMWSLPNITEVLKKSFEKVGSYIISYQAQDNPALNNKSVDGSIPNQEKFENYRQYSLNENQLQAYVNRRPIAQYAYSLNNTNLSVTNTSFDLDHASKSNKGITQVLYKYKTIDDKEWQLATTPPSTIIPGKTYILSLIVKDEDGFTSKPYTQILGVALNMPPVALFKIDNPVMDAGTINNIEVQDYDVESDPLVNPHWWITDSLGVITIKDFGQSVPDLSKLGEGEYLIKHTTMDNPSWRGAALQALTSNIAVQKVTIKNSQPPTVKLTYAPNFIYEGDKVTLQMTPISPYGEDLKLILEESSDLGESWKRVYNNLNASSGIPINFPVDKIATGEYQYRATVYDKIGRTGTDEVQFTVHPLGIKGYVNHTELWNKHRQKYNVSVSGNKEFPRAYSMFFQGEKFMLEADTTLIDPLSNVTATNVNVEIEKYPFKTDLVNISENHWSGNLWDVSMMKWQPQKVNFKFTVTYSNGTIKTDVVTITVDKDRYWRLHRRF